MWELVNRTPFAAERTFARDRNGAEVLLVAVKATFTIGPDDRLRVSDRQLPIERAPRYCGDPERSSLRYDADFALARAATDVLLLGDARPLGGRPATVMEVGLRVGSWQKRAFVFGERRWTRNLSGWSLTDPEPFTAMPLVYERAFGGAQDDDGGGCDANPVGVGFSRGSGVPNLEDPSDLITAPDATPRPTSFGPIARHWPLRRRLAGTYDERWRRERRPLVPEDFDDAFWQSAPADQRVVLEGGEDVELTGVHPRGPLRFDLPRLPLSFRSRLEGRTVEHPSALHMVLFEPSEERVVIVHQSALPCHHSIHSLERTIVEEAS